METRLVQTVQAPSIVHVTADTVEMVLLALVSTFVEWIVSTVTVYHLRVTIRVVVDAFVIFPLYTNMNCIY